MNTPKGPGTNNAPKQESFGDLSKGMVNDMKDMKNMKPGDFMPGKQTGMPTALKVIQWLLIIGAALSLIGALGLFSYAPFAAILALISMALSLVAVWGINKRRMWGYWLLIAFIVYSVIVAFVSWRGGNVLTLVIDAVMLYYVTKSKGWFLANK